MTICCYPMVLLSHGVALHQRLIIYQRVSNEDSRVTCNNPRRYLQRIIKTLVITTILIKCLYNIMGEAELTRFFPKHQQLPLLVPLMDHRQKVCIYILFRSIIFFHHGHGCFYMSNWLVRLDRFRVRSFVGVTNGRTKFLLHPL